MKSRLEKNIRDSNVAVSCLIDLGYSIQGRTSNLNSIAIEKNGELFFYSSYKEAFNNIKEVYKIWKI